MWKVSLIDNQYLINKCTHSFLNTLTTLLDLPDWYFVEEKQKQSFDQCNQLVIQFGQNEKEKKQLWSTLNEESKLEVREKNKLRVDWPHNQ